MGARITKTYNYNPFEPVKQARSAIIYCPTDYYLSKIVSLSPAAVRTLFVLGKYYNLETGLIEVSTTQIRKHVDLQRYNLSRALTELAKANIIAKHIHLGKYYMNPDVFRIVTYEL